MGESTRRYGLDQPLSEAELARAWLSVRLMQTSSGTADDDVIPRLLSTPRWQAKQEISGTMMSDPDEEVMIERDKPSRFTSGFFFGGGRDRSVLREEKIEEPHMGKATKVDESKRKFNKVPPKTRADSEKLLNY